MERDIAGEGPHRLHRIEDGDLPRMTSAQPLSGPSAMSSRSWRLVEDDDRVPLFGLAPFGNRLPPPPDHDTPVAVAELDARGARHGAVHEGLDGGRHAHA